VVAVWDAARQIVDSTSNPSAVVATIQKWVLSVNDRLFDELDDDWLVLYRRRAQALIDAHRYPYHCRLRMSGLPSCIHPWIGAVLWRHTDDVIQLEEFIRLWEEVTDVESLLCTSLTSNDAWNLLHRHAAAKPKGIN